MSDYNILCAGGCGTLQGYTDRPENVARHRVYCAACAAKQARPILTNTRQARLNAFTAKIKAEGVTPAALEELTKIIAELR